MKLFNVFLSSGVLGAVAPAPGGALREEAVKIQLLEWQLGIANSTGIAGNILTETGDLEGLTQRTVDTSKIRFKLLMGMLVWTHQAKGIIYHTYLPHLSGRHSALGMMSQSQVSTGIEFKHTITSNTENEAYAEYTMELYHGYGCHCMPDHSHYIFTGGKGRPADHVDLNCALLRTCYSCIEESDIKCDSHSQTYSYALNRPVAGQNWYDPITCTDRENTCARKVCECDKQFAINAADLYVKKHWHHDNSHNHFDQQSRCEPRGGGKTFTKCERAHRQSHFIDEELSRCDHDNPNCGSINHHHHGNQVNYNHDQHNDGHHDDGHHQGAYNSHHPIQDLLHGLDIHDDHAVEDVNHDGHVVFTDTASHHGNGHSMSHGSHHSGSHHSMQSGNHHRSDPNAYNLDTTTDLVTTSTTTTSTTTTTTTTITTTTTTTKRNTPSGPIIIGADGNVQFNSDWQMNWG